MHPTLPALLDRLIPADEFPSATQNGVLDFWERTLSPSQKERHALALDALDAEARARFTQPFAALQAPQQDAILDAIEAGQPQTAWPFEARAWLQQAAHGCAEGFYADPSNGANAERASWRMVGFERTVERPLVQEKLEAEAASTAAPPASTFIPSAPPSTEAALDGAPSSTPASNVAPTPGGADENAVEAASTSGAAPRASTSSATLQASTSVGRAASPLDDFYDVVIVGAGAGGGATACTLSEAGLRVLVLERGRDLGFDQIPRDHLRSQRLPVYGHNAGPDESHPRVFVSPEGKESTILPWQGGYQNNAACVGGGTRVYGAQAWRFMPQDFRMASEYGVPAGSSLVDWPFDYSEMEPWYEAAEVAIGVAGDGAAMDAHHAPRQKPFPLPPLDPIRRTPILKSAAAELGWPTFPTPLAIASRPYGGRAACVRCTECVGFPCPTGAKAGSHNTFLPRALAAGCTLQTGAIAAQVDVDAAGRVQGATFFVREGASPAWNKRSVKARAVVLAGGAVESARLLLLSQSALHPQGLGNTRGLVGRNLQGHYYTGAFGVHPSEVFENNGPGPTVATNRWNHSSEARAAGIVGGGMLADDFLKPPIDFWKGALPPKLQRWGAANKEWMRRNFKRTLQVMGPIHEIPNPEARVQIDSHARDAWGLPVARVSGTAHTETVRTAEFVRARAEEWLRAAGCETIWSHPASLYLSGGQHQAGTCRMSDDADSGVCDHWGRVHGHDNLWVLDGSLHPTNGGFNPFLTIMALALRGADKLVQSL
jgi:choline dehydrogenase-like flavoprotein